MNTNSHQKYSSLSHPHSSKSFFKKSGEGSFFSKNKEGSIFGPELQTKPFISNASASRTSASSHLTSSSNQSRRAGSKALLIQKAGGRGQSELARLKEILDYFNVPEEEVIAIFGSLNEADSNTALNDSTLKDQALSSLSNYEMYMAMRYCDGDIVKRLEWMFEEGTSWSYVRAVLRANTQNTARIRNSNYMRIQFADVCDNDTMLEAVNILGGDLNFQLKWIAYEGTSSSVIYNKIRNAPTGELARVLADRQTMKFLREDQSSSAYQRIEQMLNGLLVWEEIDRRASEKHFEDFDSDGTWELETFGWQVNYDIEYHRNMLRIIVRIELDGETVPAATKTRWLNGIRNRWNGHFHIQGPRRLNILFDPIFTDDDNHTSVNVHAGSGREDSSNWYLNTTGDTAAHEFGHLIGLEDEYQLTAADYQRLIGASPTATGSTAISHTPSGSFNSSDRIMVSGAGNVRRRHLASYLRWLNSNRLPGERPYRLVLGP